MANRTGKSHASPAQDEATKQSGFTSTPALRHVGPTLEADPNYLDRTDRTAEDGSTGFSTPEDQIARQGASPESGPGRGATDLAANLAGTYGSDDSELPRDRRPEPLKTRLPGDTSSDPHTDLGPDNATTVQHRGER